MQPCWKLLAYGREHKENKTFPRWCLEVIIIYKFWEEKKFKVMFSYDSEQVDL